jgi:hypothetical protein
VILFPHLPEREREKEKERRSVDNDRQGGFKREDEDA